MHSMFHCEGIVENVSEDFIQKFQKELPQRNERNGSDTATR